MKAMGTLSTGCFPSKSELHSVFRPLHGIQFRALNLTVNWLRAWNPVLRLTSGDSRRVVG
jgi:hypothetical protein